MSICRLLSLSLVLIFSLSAAAQTRGGGGSHGATTSSMVNPTANANGARATGTGGNLDTSVRPGSAADESKVEFRSQTVLVQVPVVVTDKSGQHIHGLNKEDFAVLENGKPVNVTNFEELRASSAPLAPPTVAAGQFRNLTIDGQQPRNIVVVALDTVNTPFLDQASGRRELVKFLAKNVDSGQVLALMLITSRGLKVVQGLTGDPANLTQILKKASGEIPQMQGISTDAPASSDPFSTLNDFVNHGDALEAQFFQQNAIEITMNAFLGIAQSLSGIPGRKSLLWATGSFPFGIDSPATVPGGYLSILYERTMLALNQADVSVYPVDIRGLMGNGMVSAANRGSMSGQGLSRQLINRAWLQQSKFDTLNDFADMTGGKAFYNTNDLAGSFKRAADDGSSYYMLSYYLDTHNNKPGWRKLQVKVDKKDIEVRSRSGFFVTNTTMNPLLSRSIDMKNALHSPIEGTGVPVTVRWLSVSAEGDKKKAEFMARMSPGGLSFDSSGRNQLDFDFAALAYDKDGKEAGQAAQNFNKPISDSQVASVKASGVGFRNVLELAPGKYTVRFVVRDNVTGKIGSVTAPLTVN